MNQFSDYPTLRTPCPTCGRGIGEWCKKADGTAYHKKHSARRKLERELRLSEAARR